MSDPRQKDFDERHAKLPVVTALTKREYFSVMAMQGILSNPGTSEQLALVGISGDIKSSVLVAKTALLVADELLKQLQ